MQRRKSRKGFHLRYDTVLIHKKRGRKLKDLNRLNKIINLLIALGLFIFLLCPTSSSASNNKQNNHFVVAVGDYDYLPYTGFVNDKFAGFGAEVLTAFAKSRGYTFEYRRLSVPRMFKEFLEADETIDFMYPNNQYWNEAEQKKKQVIFSEPVIEYVDGVLVLEKNKDMTLEELKDLVVMKGFDAVQYKKYVEQKKIRIFEHSDILGSMRMIQNGRMQGAYLNPVVAAYYQQTVLGGKPLFLAESLPYIKSSYLLSSIKHPKIIEEFNSFLASEKELMGKLKLKYAVDDPFLKDPKQYKAPQVKPLLP